MANTSEHPITVDGVRLDTLAWGIARVNRAVAARRERNVEIPGRDGVIPSLGDDLEPVQFGLEMLVLGSDEDGVVPPEGRRVTFRRNLDSLIHLFGKRHSLLEVRETVEPGVERRAWAKVQDTIAPDLNASSGASAEVVVSLVLPYAVWEDAEDQTWTQVAPVDSASVLTLQGATESIPDAVYAVKGPAVNPRITDPASGTWVQLNDTLTTSQVWRLNALTWSTRVGTTLTVDSGDIEGTDKTAVTVTGGPQRGVALTLTPVLDAGARRVGVTLSATSGIVAGDTSLTIKARRKYAI